ncbi:hypothetical protein SNEBB_009159 [Seison nebaliae]|nr:hypothetical protein SNEBB_009159 [Seison nebaliae]
MNSIYMFKDLDLKDELNEANWDELEQMVNITEPPDYTEIIGTLNHFKGKTTSKAIDFLSSTPIIPAGSSRLPLLVLLPVIAGLCLIIGGILKVVKKRRRPPTLSAVYDIRQVLSNITIDLKRPRIQNFIPKF